MDSLDAKLMRLLAKDARQSSEALAKQLEVSAATTRRRITRLLNSKVLRIVGVVDHSKIGFPVAVIVGFDVEHKEVSSFMKILASRPEVRWSSITTGRFDVMALLRFHSTDELYNFIQSVMANASGLRDSETFLCIHEDKGRYSPLLSDPNDNVSNVSDKKNHQIV